MKKKTMAFFIAFVMRIAVMLISVTTIAAGCGSTVEPEAPIPTPTPVPVQEEDITPQSGGNLKMAMRIPKTLNPLLNKDATVDAALKLIFEPLAVLNEEQKPQPNLADYFDFASDGSSLTIHLRNDVYWSDGEPMTADDLIFTLNTLDNAPDDVIYKQSVQNIASYQKQDMQTVRINYIKNSSGSAYLLCFPIIPKHYYDQEKEADSLKNMTPLGNGAYTFVSYSNIKEVTLAANENYFRQRPYIDNITAIITPDAQADLYAFDHGIIDVVSANIADWGKYSGSKNTNVTEYPTTYFDFIGFNLNNMILKDIKIRQAIAHAVSVNQILDEIYLFHALKASSPVSPVGWLYNPDVKVYDYDPEAARTLISEMGYVENGGVLQRDLNGVKMDMTLHILVNEENEERVKIAGKLKKSLNDLKIISEVEELPFEEFEARVSEGKFDLFVGGFNLSVNPDLTFAFHSEGSANYFGYRSEAMDLLLGQARNALGDLNYKKAMGEVQRQIAADLPIISLVFRKSAVLTDQKVMGEPKPVLNNIFNNINQWFIYEES